MLMGSVFHATVPATVKERSPNLVHVRRMSSVLDTGMQHVIQFDFESL